MVLFRRSRRLCGLLTLSLVVSSVLCGAAEAAPIVAPTSLTAQVVSTSAIQLTWNDPNNRESHYLVERSLNATSGFVQIVSLNRNVKTYTSTGLAAGTTYFFRVRASGGPGVFSPYSPVANATTTGGTDTVPPSVPVNVSASPTSCTSVLVSWSASTDTGGSGLKGYNVKRGAVVKFVATPATSLNDTGLAASTPYSYTVTALDNVNNESVPSAAVNVVTTGCADTIPPSVPTGVGASASSR